MLKFTAICHAHKPDILPAGVFTTGRIAISVIVLLNAIVVYILLANGYLFKSVSAFVAFVTGGEGAYSRNGYQVNRFHKLNCVAKL